MLTTSGVVLRWEIVAHHIALHAVFHFAIRFVLKIGGRLMVGVIDMVKSTKKVPGNLVTELKELVILALATAATTT